MLFAGKCLCGVYLLQTLEKRIEGCISGFFSLYQAYIESATVICDTDILTVNDSLRSNLLHLRKIQISHLMFFCRLLS